MSISWAERNQHAYGRQIIKARHSLHNSPLFCDASLAALLDTYPRDRLGIWTFAEHGEGEEAPVRGTAPDMSGEDLLEAVRRGRIWLNLRAANQLVPDYAHTSDSIFDSIEDASGRRVFKRDMGILISSPGVNVHYHLDIPQVALFQVRGEKTLWLYPPTEAYAPSERVEAIAMRTCEEGLHFKDAFDEAAKQVKLKPGMALTWPQMAPHRVQNGDMMNVSLSCEFMTLPGLIRANAVYANGRMRKQFGAKPSMPTSLTPATLGKAAFARLLKHTSPRHPLKTPTPPSFTIDLTSKTCTRPLTS